MKAESVNEALAQSYRSGLDAIGGRWPEGEGVSFPHLIKATDAYCDAAVRVMIVGQEPLGWDNYSAEEHTLPVALRPTANRNTIEEIMSIYATFSLAQDYRSTPFWAVAHEAAARLNPGGATAAWAWSNLVKISERERRPSTSIEQSMERGDWLRREIDILHPHVILFFTGPNYDTALARAVGTPTTQWESVEGATPRQVVSVPLLGLSALAVRTYHPKYLRLRRPDLIDVAIRSLASS